MSTTKFSQTQKGFDGVETTLELTTNAISLKDVLESFELFLRGCGYAVEIGQIDLGEKGE